MKFTFTKIDFKSMFIIFSKSKGEKTVPLIFQYFYVCLKMLENLNYSYACISLIQIRYYKFRLLSLYSCILLIVHANCAKFAFTLHEAPIDGFKSRNNEANF